ncbi:hypothetical protein Pan44_45970 [Caulifigura coniformis]|uniref:Lipocalin-like domain-containing protein n=1 Tax=Caulifigura coniformis TaxID=2527983 RepID=A0A517SKA4_9PLAN|nr:hypothetical protein [Caulifigura coniformis]QDT56541.1 hypothetical protein Pan44_45970 [Caulifigura coniformis]
MLFSAVNGSSCPASLVARTATFTIFTMADESHFSVSRRTAAIGAVALLATGLALGTFFAPSRDECLVGTWRVKDSTSFPRGGRLELQRDGSALLTEFQESPYAAVWKCSGDELEVTLVSRHRPDLDEPSESGLNWRLQWKILEKTPDLLQLEGPVNGGQPSGRVSLIKQ